MIKFLDLKKLNEKYSVEIKKAVNAVIDSGYYIGGPAVTEFEENFAKYNQMKYCVGTGNGLDSIRIILESYKVLGKLKDKDIVLVPSNTFIASIIAVQQAGLTPVLIEPREDDMLIDVNLIEEHFEKADIKAKAVLCVNLYGKLCDYDSILELKDKYNFILIEDSAQSHGAVKNGKKNHGDAIAFSFYPGKNLGAMGDAGAIITNDKILANTCRKYGSYGSDKKYVHDIQGINSRLDPIQAAILNVKLKYLESELITRRLIANKYSLLLEGCTLPCSNTINGDAWHLYVIRLKDKEQRDKLLKHLEDNEVQCLIHYPIAPCDQKYMINFKENKIAKKIANTCLSLPISSNVSFQEVEKISKLVNEFLK